MDIIDNDAGQKRMIDPPQRLSRLLTISLDVVRDGDKAGEAKQGVKEGNQGQGGFQRLGCC